MFKPYLKLHPYQKEDKWFFDEPSLNLYMEGLTDGTPEVILRAMNILKIKKPIFVRFSNLPQFRFELQLLGQLRNGHQYFWKEQNMICWFCPALLKYFTKPPKSIWFDCVKMK
jgi:hypothetical protein